MTSQISHHRRLDYLPDRSSRCRSKKTLSSASLAFMRGIHRWPVNSPHKGPVTRKMLHLMTPSWWNISIKVSKEQTLWSRWNLCWVSSSWSDLHTHTHILWGKLVQCHDWWNSVYCNHTWLNIKFLCTQTLTFTCIPWYDLYDWLAPHGYRKGMKHNKSKAWKPSLSIR